MDELRLLIKAQLDKQQVKESVNDTINKINGSSKSLKPILMNIAVDKGLLKQQVNAIVGEVNKQLAKSTIKKFDLSDFISSTKSAKEGTKSLKRELSQLQIVYNKIQSQRVKNFLSTKSQYLDSKTELGSRRLYDKLDVGETTIGRKEASLLKAMSTLHRERARETERIYKANIKEVENYAKATEKNLARVGFASEDSRKKLEILQKTLSKLKDSKYSDKNYKQLYEKGRTLGKTLSFSSEKQASDFREKLLNQEKEKIKQVVRSYYELNKARVGNSEASRLSGIIEKADIATDAKGIKLARTEFQILKKEMDTTRKSSELIGTTFKETAGKMIAGIGIYRAIMLAIRGLKSMYDEVKKIDTAMTDLKKVTNETEGTYDSFLRKAGEDAKALRSSISDLVQSTAEWARLGYSLQEAQENARASIILSHVGDVDIDTATKATISGLKAYGSELKNTMMLVDKYNEVGNNYAISSAGIAEAMRRSASSLKLAGNSLDEAIAIITAGNNVIQNPEMVGTMVKTMTMRLRGTSGVPQSLREELEEMGEDLSDFEEHVTQVQAKMTKFTQGRVNIMQDPNTFKSTYQILKEIQMVWDDLTDKDRASVVELIAGKRGGSIATAIIENMDEAERVKETSMNSFGSALREQERWAESIEGHLGELSASWQELSSTTVNSEMIKYMIDLLRVVTELTTAFGGLVPVATVLIAVLAGLKFKNIGVVLSQIPLLVSGLQAVGLAGAEAGTMISAGLSAGVLGAIVAGLWAIVKVADVLHVSFEEQLEIVHELGEEYKETISNIDSYKEELANVKAKVEELNNLKLNGQITEQQEKELGLLQKQNKELETKLRIEESLANYQKRELDKEATKLLNKKDKYYYTESTDWRQGSKLHEVNQIDYLTGMIDVIKQQRETLNTEREKLAKVDTSEFNIFSKYNYESSLAQLEKQEEELEKRINKINSHAKTLQEIKVNLQVDNPLVQEIDNALQKFVEFDQEQNINTTLENTSNTLEIVERAVKSVGEQMEFLTDRQKDLTSYIDEYNNKGVLQYNTVLSMLQKYPDMIQYLNQTKDGYVLNTNAIEGLNNVTERQKMLLDDYIKSQKEAIGIGTGYLENSNSFLDSILKDRSSTRERQISPIGEQGEVYNFDNMDTSGLTDLVNTLKQLNTAFMESKITTEEYFKGLQNEINNIDFSKLDTSEDLQKIASVLSGNLSNGLKDIINGFQTGQITVDEYTSRLESANKAMLDMRVRTEGLTLQNGVWKNTSGEVDEFANSINNAIDELNYFDSYIQTITKNAEYLKENINAIGELEFDVSDESSSKFKAFVNDINAELNNIQVTAPSVFENVVNAIADTKGVLASEILDSTGKLKDGILNDAQAMNVAVNEMNRSLGDSIKRVTQAGGKVISAFGDMIKNFDYKMDVSVSGATFKDVIQGFMLGQNITSTIRFKGSGDNGSVSNFASAISSLGSEITSLASSQINLDKFFSKPLRSNIPNAPIDKKGGKKGKGGSGRDKDKKEIETVNEYEQSIKKLDLTIEKLQSTREKMIEGSEEYNRSLQKELDLTRQKEILTQKELASVEKQLKKYANLKAPVKPASAKVIDNYNKKLKEKTTLENKSIDLQKTLNGLASKQEDILRKQADIIAESSNKRISELDQEIAILESKQALVSTNSKDYFDFQAQKVEYLIEKQRQYQQDIIKTKALLSSADARGYSGSQKDKWKSDLRDAEQKWYETEKAIREAEKQERLENIKNRINQVSAISEVISNVISDFRDKLSLIAEDDFVNKISIVTNAIGYAQKNVGSLVGAYRDLASIQPQTREEAEQLASEMTNLAKQIFESNKATLEYKRQLDNLVVEQLSNKFKSDMDKLNGLMALFQHNVNLLEDGLVDGTDISFDIGILPDIPQSNYDKERAEIEALFEEKQRYEQEIQALKRQSFEEQSRLRDKYNQETLNEEKEFNSETQKEMITNYDEIVRLLAKGLGIEVETLDGGHKTMLEIVKASLFETKDIYNMTWQEIVATVSQALNTIAQANKKAGEYAYANFDANNKFLGLTYGKNGRSNHFSNSSYVVSESGKVFNTKGGRKADIPDYLKRIPKYADGTQDGHKGGLALISEFDREEMVIFPDGSTKVFRNATLVDLPKGSHVLSPEETRDIKRYVGSDFDDGKVPKYARGTGYRSKVRPDPAGRGSSTFIRKDRNGRTLYKEKDGVVIEDNRDERGNYREKKAPNDPELQRIIDHYGGDPRVKIYRNSSNQIVVEDTTFSHTYDGLYGSRRTYNHLPSGTVLIDAQGVASTINTGYEYTDAKGRTITVGNEQYKGMIRNGADASRFRQTNHNLTYFDRENTIKSSNIRNQELGRRWGLDDEDSRKGRENYKKFLEIQDKGLQELRKWQEITGRIDTIGGRPNFGYSYGNEGYYNRNGQTGHTKELDKIKFDTLFPKEIVKEFEEYKTQRDVVQKAIKAEQDVIKKHFSQGGIRKDVQKQIDNLIEKIDEQTRKDVEMQFKMTESILKKQQELSKEYMEKTEKAYLDGIKNGLSTEALKKLRDSYAEARQEHQQYEQALKNNIKSRFEYEFAMLDKRQNKYREFQNDVGFKLDILNTATDSKDYEQQLIYNEQLVGSYREQLKSLTDEYSTLEKAQSKYSVGSFEWNLYEQQLKKVKQELQGINKSLADTIVKNKELVKNQLEENYKNLNKDVEKLLFNGGKQQDAERELQKKKDKYAEYIEGIEKEYNLELLIRDLKKEKIDSFDTELEMLKKAEKISRDDLELLKKRIEIKKIETALDKIKGNRRVRELKKDKDGKFDWDYTEDKDLVKNLEDKLTQAKIDLLRLTKDIDLKTQDKGIREKIEFLDRLQEIQRKSLNGEYKNKGEFEDELKKLGLTLNEYQEWANKVKDKITNTDSKDTVLGIMNKSFQDYTKSLDKLNERLEQLLLALKIDKTIPIPEHLRGRSFLFDENGKLKGTNGSNSVDNKLIKDLNNLINAIKDSKLNPPIYKIPEPYKPPVQTLGDTTVNINTLELPSVKEYKQFLDELSQLGVRTKG